jgi:hypothetical protein
LVGRSHLAENSFLQVGKGAENTKEKSRAVLYVSSQDEPEVRELTWNFISSLALSFLLFLFFLIEL